MALVWLVALLAALLVAGLLAVATRAAVHKWRPRRLPRRTRSTPVVLAHGILGFDDLGAQLLRGLRLDQALGPILDVQALHDLTTSRMLAFNREVRDVPGVRYLSIVARAPRGGVHPLLILAHRWLHRYGENDGLV